MFIKDNEEYNCCPAGLVRSHRLFCKWKTSQFDIEIDENSKITECHHIYSVTVSFPIDFKKTVETVKQGKTS